MHARTTFQLLSMKSELLSKSINSLRTLTKFSILFHKKKRRQTLSKIGLNSNLKQHCSSLYIIFILNRNSLNHEFKPESLCVQHSLDRTLLVLCKICTRVHILRYKIVTNLCISQKPALLNHLGLSTATTIISLFEYSIFIITTNQISVSALTNQEYRF